MVVERDFLLRMAAALLEEAQLAADPQEAEEATQRADDIITLVDELSAPDYLDTTPH
jgi:Asp-tRNA(Asn)/Glu-tRNA(Gln) amidotransferase C subunit